MLARGTAQQQLDPLLPTSTGVTLTAWRNQGVRLVAATALRSFSCLQWAATSASVKPVAARGVSFPCKVVTASCSSMCVNSVSHHTT